MTSGAPHAACRNASRPGNYLSEVGVFEDFLAHEHALAAWPCVDQAYPVLTLVDAPPQLEHVEPLGAVRGIANRRERFHRVVDRDAVVGSDMKNEELASLIDGGSSALMRLLLRRSRRVDPDAGETGHDQPADNHGPRRHGHLAPLYIEVASRAEPHRLRPAEPIDP